MELDRFLKAFGMISTREDRFVYTNSTNNLIVLIYVDDILIGYDDENEMNVLICALHTMYGVKDLREVN